MQKIKELLKPRKYVAVKTEQMQGILLTVFVKRKHLLHIQNIETDYIRTGLGGIWVCNIILFCPSGIFPMELEGTEKL